MAGLDYDAAREVPLGAFIYRQAIASTWTRYRQEWAYCLHTAPETLEEIEKVLPRRETGAIDPNLYRKLSKAFDQLSLPEQWLIRQIFWHGATQGGLALVLRISQQAVSRRKARALKHLRRLLHGEPRSHFVARLLAVCAFLNQALDFFPVLDCGL
jgi:DNA-directed RNA polymerase specialized sigma24 family protein